MHKSLFFSVLPIYLCKVWLYHLNGDQLFGLGVLGQLHHAVRTETNGHMSVLVAFEKLVGFALHAIFKIIDILLHGLCLYAHCNVHLIAPYCRALWKKQLAVFLLSTQTTVIMPKASVGILNTEFRTLAIYL